MKLFSLYTCVAMTTQLAKFIRTNVELNLASLNETNNYFKFDSETTINLKRKKLQRILEELDDPEYAYRKYYASSYFPGSVDLNRCASKLDDYKTLMKMSDAKLVESCINNWMPYRIKRKTYLRFPVNKEFEMLIHYLRANDNYIIDINAYDDFYDLEVTRRERIKINVAEHEALTVFNRIYLARLFKKTSVTIASFLPWKEFLIKLGYSFDENNDKILTLSLA